MFAGEVLLVPLGGTNEVGPLRVLNRDEFVLALNEVGPFGGLNRDEFALVVNEVGPLGVLNRDGFVLALNEGGPLGTPNNEFVLALNGVGPLGLSNRDRFVLALNPVGSTKQNRSYSESKSFFISNDPLTSLDRKSTSISLKWRNGGRIENVTGRLR